MYDEYYQALIGAIILQAVKDFKPAYRRLKRFPADKLAQENVRRITKFFCSPAFESLSNLDGPALLNQIIREMDKRYEKNGLT